MATSYVCQIGKGVEKVLFSDQFLSVGTFRLLRAIVEKVFFPLAFWSPHDFSMYSNLEDCVLV